MTLWNSRGFWMHLVVLTGHHVCIRIWPKWVNRLCMKRVMQLFEDEAKNQ